MREGHGLANFPEDAQTIGQRSAFGPPVQPLPADEPHGVVHAAVGQLAGVVHGHDPGVLEAGHDARLLVHSLRLFGVSLPESGDLEGDLAVEPCVYGPVYRTHAPAPELLDDRVGRVGCLRPIRGAPQTPDRLVGEKGRRPLLIHRARLQAGSAPRIARASSRNSRSLPVMARNRSRTRRRKVRRAKAS